MSKNKIGVNYGSIGDDFQEKEIYEKVDLFKDPDARGFYRVSVIEVETDVAVKKMGPTDIVKLQIEEVYRGGLRVGKSPSIMLPKDESKMEYPETIKVSLARMKDLILALDGQVPNDQTRASIKPREVLELLADVDQAGVSIFVGKECLMEVKPPTHVKGTNNKIFFSPVEEG